MIASIAPLVEFQVQAGVAGLAVLGFLGEAHKLSNAERREVVGAFVQASAGRIPVWVGVRALGLAGTIEQACVYAAPAVVIAVIACAAEVPRDQVN